MFYEEKLINGIWHCRCSPYEEFKPISLEEMNIKYNGLKEMYNILVDEYYAKNQT